MIYTVYISFRLTYDIYLALICTVISYETRDQPIKYPLYFQANRNRQPTARLQMGSGNSQPQTHGNSVIDEPDGTFPFQIRRDAVHQLQLVFDKVSDSHQWAETYQQKIDAVKQVLTWN